MIVGQIWKKCRGISDYGLPGLFGGRRCGFFVFLGLALDEKGLFVVDFLEVDLDGVVLEVLRRIVGFWEVVELVTYAFFEDLFVLLLFGGLDGLSFLGLLLGLFFLLLGFAEMVDIGFVLKSRLRLEFDGLLGPSFFSLLLVMFYDPLMAFLWFSWFDFFEIEGLRNCLMPVLCFPGLKKQHLVVMHLLKIRNAVAFALKMMIFGKLLLQFFLFFSNVLIVIFKILHGGRKACTLQQLCGSSLLLRLVTCSKYLRLIGCLRD